MGGTGAGRTAGEDSNRAVEVLEPFLFHFS